SPSVEAPGKVSDASNGRLDVLEEDARKAQRFGRRDPDIERAIGTHGGRLRPRFNPLQRSLDGRHCAGATECAGRCPGKGGGTPAAKLPRQIRAPAAMAAAPETLTYTRDRRKRRAIIASIITGTTIEWYDFYLFGSLGKVIGPHFYKTSNQYNDLLIWLGAYATCFLIRPVCAADLRRPGALKGRKAACLTPLLMMGGATTAIGLLPGHATIGALAPALLVLMRLVQGFALGGEYGGAVIFV